MPQHALPLCEGRRSDLAIWGVIASVAGAILLSSATGSFVFVWSSFIKPWLVVALLVTGSIYYRYSRKELPLAEALAGSAQIIAFASVAAPLSYVAAAAALPLWDADFAAWDRRLGCDWTAWLAFMNANPLLHRVGATAYASFAVQTTAVVVVLGYARQSRHWRIFQIALMATTLVTIAISALMPAAGAWGFWHLSLSDAPNIVPVTRDLPLPVFFGLRDGSYRLLVADHADGIISFPSLHAALGLLFILGLWPVRSLRWIGFAVNAVMIAATPIDGSHYFADVIAGLAVAGSAWLATSWLLSSRRPPPIGAIEAGPMVAAGAAPALGDPNP
jgi:membrane-associated phospholipid phosphatase